MAHRRRRAPRPSTPAEEEGTAHGQLAGAASALDARVEQYGGSAAPSWLVQAALRLLRRNLDAFGAVDCAEKRRELTHARTRTVAVVRGRTLLAYASYRLVVEETVRVAYLYELHVDACARRSGLGRALVAVVEDAGRRGGARGLMLTVQLANTDAIRFYTRGLGLAVSPISPSACAPAHIARACDYELLQRIWDDRAEKTLRARGAEARDALEGDGPESPERPVAKRQRTTPARTRR